MARFNDSVEATEFMHKLLSMLQDPRLEEWVNATDENFGTSTTNQLMRARDEFEDLVEEMENV